MDDVLYTLLLPTLAFGAMGFSTGAVLAVSKARPIARDAILTSLNFAVVGGTFTLLRSTTGQVARRYTLADRPPPPSPGPLSPLSPPASASPLSSASRETDDSPTTTTTTTTTLESRDDKSLVNGTTEERRMRFESSERVARTWVSLGSGAVTGMGFSAAVRGGRGLLGAGLLYGGSAGVLEYGYQSLRYPDPATPAASSSSSTTAGRVMAGSERDGVVWEESKSIWTRLKESSPMRTLPDEEYEAILRNKVTALDQQIALTGSEMERAREALEKFGGVK